MTIGGGSNVVVTQNGTFTVAVGETGAAKTLPLTGVTVAGKCELVTAPPAPSEGGLARILSASSGTMDAIASSGTGGQVGTFGGTTLTTGARRSSWQRRVQRHREWGWIGDRDGERRNRNDHIWNARRHDHEELRVPVAGDGGAELNRGLRSEGQRGRR